MPLPVGLSLGFIDGMTLNDETEEGLKDGDELPVGWLLGSEDGSSG